MADFIHLAAVHRDRDRAVRPHRLRDRHRIERAGFGGPHRLRLVVGAPEHQSLLIDTDRPRIVPAGAVVRRPGNRGAGKQFILTGDHQLGFLLLREGIPALRAVVLHFFLVDHIGFRVLDLAPFQRNLGVAVPFIRNHADQRGDQRMDRSVLSVGNRAEKQYRVLWSVAFRKPRLLCLDVRRLQRRKRVAVLFRTGRVVPLDVVVHKLVLFGRTDPRPPAAIVLVDLVPDRVRHFIPSQRHFRAGRPRSHDLSLHRHRRQRLHLVVGNRRHLVFAGGVPVTAGAVRMFLGNGRVDEAL